MHMKLAEIKVNKIKNLKYFKRIIGYAFLSISNEMKFEVFKGLF